MQTPEQIHNQNQPQEEAQSLQEKERMEINKRCYARARQTIESVRNAWRSREYTNEREREIDKQTCEFEARKRDILLNLLEEKGLDFTRGYRRMTDAIADPTNPNNPALKDMTRTHSKFLDSETAIEYNRRLATIFKEEQDAGLHKHDAIRFSRERIRLSEDKYQLGDGMEEYLGGKRVRIRTGQATKNKLETTFSLIFVEIQEGIIYDRETKKYSIEPGTELKDNIGRLKVQKIPTVTSDTTKWHAHYQE